MSVEVTLEACGTSLGVVQLNKVTNKEQIGCGGNESVCENDWPAIVEKFLGSCHFM